MNFFLEANSTNAHKVVHHELCKKDDKVLFLIHQYMGSDIFENIIVEETTKDAWDRLNKL